MKDNTTDFLWNRINELFAETNRLKTELKQVTKERDEYSARWENLNKEVEKKFTYKASRTFAHTAFAERVDMTVMFDLDLYRASKIDMIDGLCRQVYETLSYEIEKRFSKKPVPSPLRSLTKEDISRGEF